MVIVSISDYLYHTMSQSEKDQFESCDEGTSIESKERTSRPRNQGTSNRTQNVSSSRSQSSGDDLSCICGKSFTVKSSLETHYSRCPLKNNLETERTTTQTRHKMKRTSEPSPILTPRTSGAKRKSVSVKVDNVTTFEEDRKTEQLLKSNYYFQTLYQCHPPHLYQV